MSIRMASLCGLAVACVLSIAGSSPATAQQVVKLGEGETLTISGFINATLFNDRGLFSSFGQGQNAEIAACPRSEEHTSELQSRLHLVCRLLLEKKKPTPFNTTS